MFLEDDASHSMLRYFILIMVFRTLSALIGRSLLAKFLKAGQIGAGLIRAKIFGQKQKNGQF